MFSAHILALVFRLLNFMVIVGLFVYLFRRYVLQWIYATLADRKKNIDDLEHTINVLHAEHESFDRHNQERELMHQQLTFKLEQWNERFAQEQKQYQQRAEKQRELMARTNAIRSRFLALQKIEQKLLPIVIGDIEKNLQAKYSNQDNGRAFLDRIIIHVREDVA